MQGPVYFLGMYPPRLASTGVGGYLQVPSLTVGLTRTWHGPGPPCLLLCSDCPDGPDESCTDATYIDHQSRP